MMKLAKPKLRKLTKRESFLIVLLIILLIGGAYAFFVEYPVQKGIKQAKSEISEVNKQIKKDKELIEQMEKMQKELELKKADNASVSTIPKYDNTLALTAYLGEMFQKMQDYSFSTNSINMPDGSSGIVRRTISLDFKCKNYEQAKEIIKDLEYGPYLCQINTLNLTPVKQSGKSGAAIGPKDTIHISLTITYFERKG